MRIIIIDDERIAREGLLEFSKAFDFIECVGDFANAFHAKELVVNKEVDLMFLDIDMPHIKGIQFAEMVNNSSTMIVFTTAHPEYALNGYKVNTIDYLLKPIFFEDFKKAVLKAKGMYDLIYPDSDGPKSLFFRENGADRRILLDDILYIKSMQNYVQIYLDGQRNIIVHQTLKNVLEMLPTGSFIQIHRSYVVQIRFILSIDGNSVVLPDAILPIARERKSYLLELLIKK
ncbi:DNA-binding response regulator [Elizabethkingia anophelis]|nr:DNA-binding response regulator [Elizabethkingia anophelis]MDV3970133.1 DNA-binding response regulator [Elizabethkingia anophelis]